jgi:hypothetical protein
MPTRLEAAMRRDLWVVVAAVALSSTITDGSRSDQSAGGCRCASGGRRGSGPARRSAVRPRQPPGRRVAARCGTSQSVATRRKAACNPPAADGRTEAACAPTAPVHEPGALASAYSRAPVPLSSRISVSTLEHGSHSAADLLVVAVLLLRRLFTARLGASPRGLSVAALRARSIAGEPCHRKNRGRR